MPTTDLDDGIALTQFLEGKTIIAVRSKLQPVTPANGFEEIELHFSDGTQLTLATNCYYAMEVRADGNER